MFWKNGEMDVNPTPKNNNKKTKSLIYLHKENAEFSVIIMLGWLINYQTNKYKRENASQPQNRTKKIINCNIVTIQKKHQTKWVTPDFLDHISFQFGFRSSSGESPGLHL